VARRVLFARRDRSAEASVIEQLGETEPRRVASRLDRAAGGLRWRGWATTGEQTIAIRVVYAGTLAYAALFVFAAILHYKVFKTPYADLGHMVQAVWNTGHGHFLQFTTIRGHQWNRLGFHADPFLLVFVPFLWIWSSPLLLPIVQALAVASGALPVFWLARKHLDSPRAGAHFAFAYLLYPATQFNAFTITSSFHSVAIAVPLVLYAIWFLDEDRLVAFSLVALVACTTKEEIPLAIGCLGIWYAVRTGHRAFGLSVFAAGLAVTLFDFLWLIPRYAPHGANPFAARYSAVGGTPQGMAHKLVTDPLAFVHAVSSGHKAVYVAVLLLPFLGLWLLEPLLVLGALPDLAINLLSTEHDQTSIPYHWTAGIVPFVVAASIFGAARFKRRAVEVSMWVLVGVACVAIYSPIYLAKGDLKALGSPVTAAQRHAVSLIPASVPVAATNQLGAHLSGRRFLFTFPFISGARWIAVNANDSTYRDSAGLKQVVRNFRRNDAWRTVFASHGIFVLHKRSASR
jgi:uncharacterized membrane protein